MAATIKDIAQEAGVSIATVSRTLNKEDGVGPKTRQKIQAIARKLKYFPNLQARSLVIRRPNAIGIIIPRTSEFAFSNPYYAEILKGISRRARESEYYLVFSIAGEDSYAKIFHHQLAAGIIVLANRTDDSRIDEAWKMKVPMILIPGDSNKLYLPSVDIDNFEGAFQAVDYLAGLGHCRIAFLNGLMNSKYSTERLLGYHKALEKYRLPYIANLVESLDFTQEAARVGMKRLLSLKKPPTAVLVMNDYSAMGALRAAKDMGWRVPEDISIIGFGDVPFASMIDPPLTTIREPFQEMGYEAADRLLKMIQGDRLSQRHLIFPNELVIRQSTAPPPNKINLIQKRLPPLRVA